MSGPVNHTYRFGPFSIDAEKRVLLRDGEVVPLTPKAFDTLLTLVEHQGEVLDKARLMEMLWPDSEVEEANLALHISAVRKALGESPNQRRYIITVSGRGYRFAADVRRTNDDATNLIVARYTKSTLVVQDQHWPDPLELSRPIPASRAQRRLNRTMVIAAVFVVAAAALGVYWLTIHSNAKGGAVVAVPFRDMNILRLSTSGKVTHAAISPDGKYVAHVTEDAEGDSLWVRSVAAPANVRVAGPAATEYVWVTFAPDGNSIYYLALDRDKGDTDLYRVAVLGGPSSKAAYDIGPVGFSPNRKQIAFIRMENDASGVVVADDGGANERTLATREQPDFFLMTWNAPGWSPDGKTIACPVRLNDARGSYETLVGVSLNDGTQRLLTGERWHHVGQAAWLADGSGLLVTASQNATAPEQVWHIALKSGEATRVTHDLNDYHDLSLTENSTKLAAVQHYSVSSIWVAPASDTSVAKQIASDTGWIEDMAWTPEGRIIYSTNAGNSAEIWVMNADGSNPRQLTIDAHPEHGLTVSPDDRYIFFASDRAGHFNIWRVNSDGTNLKQMTAGEGDYYPECTPDARWVVYQHAEVQPTLWKVPTEGGDAVQLTKTRACRPAISPDGRMIAFHYLDPDLDKWGAGIVSSDGGPRLKRFDFPPTVAWRFVRWSPDRNSIAYANSPGGVSDIWRQPIDGSPPKRLTALKAERIFAFDWSRDSHTFAFVRGVETSDVVLIEQGQE